MHKLRLPLLVAAILLSSAAIAQHDTSLGLSLPTQQGSMMLGSNLLLADYQRLSSPHYTYTDYNINITPRVGYFVKDNLALGLTLNGGISGQTNYYYNLSGGLTAFGRYYFGKAADKNGVQNKIRFFLEAGAGYAHSVSSIKILSVNNEDSTREKYRSNSLNFNVMPGVNYFFNKNTALELGLYYQRSHTIGNDDQIYFRDTEHLGLNVGLQFFFKR